MTVGVPARAPLRRHWASPRWSWCWCCAWRASPRCRCRCVVWMRPARPLGWPRAVTNGQRSRPPAASRPAVRWFTCSETATFWSPRSSHIQSYCPRWILGPKRCRRPSRSGDRGSATVVAAAMVAVLLCITGAGAYLGSVVVARHRAQAAADLAALAAAARLPSGVTAACARATAVAHAMRVDDAQCDVDGLDVVVTARVVVAFAGAARAVARAGPA
jgi:secretion/DNA translocation related TadE-like protein